MKKTNLYSMVSSAAILVASAIAVVPGNASAQSSMAPISSAEIIPQSAEVTLVAKIKSINLETRQVDLVGKDGTEIILDAGPAVRLEMLKRGDTVTAQYYRSVAFALSTRGSPVPNDQMIKIIAKSASAPGGVAVKVIRISGLVVGVDLSSNSVEIVNPTGGLVHTAVVTDPARIAMLPQVQVGMTVTAVVSEMLAVSIKPAPKGLFW